MSATDTYNNAIREIRAVGEMDERLARMRSVAEGAVEVDQERIFGDLLGDDCEVGLTLYVVTSSGKEYQIDGIFQPRHRAKR